MVLEDQRFLSTLQVSLAEVLWEMPGCVKVSLSKGLSFGGLRRW